MGNGGGNICEGESGDSPGPIGGIVKRSWGIGDGMGGGPWNADMKEDGSSAGVYGERKDWPRSCIGVASFANCVCDEPADEGVMGKRNEECCSGWCSEVVDGGLKRSRSEARLRPFPLLLVDSVFAWPLGCG